MKKNDYRCLTVPVSKLKTMEFQISRWEDAKCFEIDGHISRKGIHDHHGFEFAVTLFWYEFRFSFYDCRHVEDLKPS